MSAPMCLDCGTTSLGKSRTRGLCHRCYRRNKFAETLDRFPVTNSPNPPAICQRCGIERHVPKGRDRTLCPPCKRHIPEPTQAEALPPGHWERHGLTWVYVEKPTHCYCGAPLAGPSCDTCLTWAEKDAQLHAERAESWANRHVIWDVLALRNEREEAA